MRPGELFRSAPTGRTPGQLRDGLRYVAARSDLILPMALGTAALIPIAGRASWPRPAKAVLVGVGLGLLPLCGASGLVFVPALASWLLGAAWADAARAGIRAHLEGGC